MIEALDRTILLCRDYVADSVSNEEIVRALQRRVLCVADEETARSHSGQTAIFTLAALLARMGMQVSVDAPEASLVAAQPPFIGKTLHSAVNSGSGQIFPGVTIGLSDTQEPDLLFIIGTGKSRHKVPCWWLTGTDWSGALVDSERAAKCWLTEWPIGAMTSALLGAGEAFKYAMRRLQLRHSEDRIFFEASHACAWTFDPVQLSPSPLDLGRVDIVSAGAITQATLYVLLRLPNVLMNGRIFDDDHTAVSNLNRNMLTLVRDLGPKVDVVARCAAPNILLTPIPRRFTATHAPLGNRVLVGVDDIPSRWTVQRHSPGWVGVSGTSHFSISSSAHRPGDPCSACLHPVDDALPAGPIPTIAYVSLWAGISLAVRLVREALRQPYPTDRQHLWLTPLRMDQPHAAIWSPVPPHPICPAQCAASRQLTLD